MLPHSVLASSGCSHLYYWPHGSSSSWDCPPMEAALFAAAANVGTPAVASALVVAMAATPVPTATTGALDSDGRGSCFHCHLPGAPVLAGASAPWQWCCQQYFSSALWQLPIRDRLSGSQQLSLLLPWDGERKCGVLQNVGGAKRQILSTYYT